MRPLDSGTGTDMRDTSDRSIRDYASFNRRRAAEERAKAVVASTDHERRCRLEMAAIFEARAEGMPTFH